MPVGPSYPPICAVRTDFLTQNECTVPTKQWACHCYRRFLVSIHIHQCKWFARNKERLSGFRHGSDECQNVDDTWVQLSFIFCPSFSETACLSFRERTLMQSVRGETSPRPQRKNAPRDLAISLHRAYCRSRTVPAKRRPVPVISGT